MVNVSLIQKYVKWWILMAGDYETNETVKFTYVLSLVSSWITGSLKQHWLKQAFY